MLWRDVLSLISTTTIQNGIGDPVISEISKDVFANQKSIRQTEFYQAAATGLKPEIMFEIRSAEYNKEQFASHNGKKYSIIRTYSKNGEILELVCAGLVNEVP